jgi:methionyl aminopeptidase
MEIKTPQEIELMRVASRVVAETLQLLREEAREGVTTEELDRAAERYIRKAGCLPAFKGYQGFPKTLCTSVNDQIVHGIPSDYELRGGDLLSVDVGTIYQGYYGDGAVTILIGAVSERHRRLAEVTEQSLYKGISQARPGNRIGDISHAVQAFVEQAGFAVVRDFVGHSIGSRMHEELQIPNYGPPNQGATLKRGMVLAIEPMVNEFTPHVRVLPDRWTAVTVDGGYSAHYEHTVAVTADGPDILTRLSE